MTDHKVVKTTGKDGVITFTGLSEGTYHFVESGVPAGYNGIDPFDIKIEFSYTGDMDTGTGNFTSTSANVVEEDGTFVITVQNNKGVELPSTGGIGTTIFYVGGSVLVLAAAILLITKRRMGNND